LNEIFDLDEEIKSMRIKEKESLEYSRIWEEALHRHERESDSASTQQAITRCRENVQLYKGLADKFRQLVDAYEMYKKLLERSDDDVK
jgi:hypothetical protein